MLQFTVSIRRVCISLLLLFSPALGFGQVKPTPSPTPQVNASARITWEGKPKVTRYRLQLARNEEFTDIVFDKVVEGREFTITEIPTGRYFWRVAPAARETAAYSKPLPVTISTQDTAGPPKLPTPTVLSPPSDIGWRTATGSIDQPMTARLRGSNFDLIGVNAYGMVYAINGENGVTLWSARYRPGAKKGEPTNSDGSPPFAPLLIEARNKQASVLVGYDSGVRALEGATGRELWRAELPGEAMAGIALSPDNDGLVTTAVFDDSRTLSFIKGDSGQIISQTKLEGFIVGRPAALTLKNERGVLLALNNGMLDVRNLAGVSMLAIRLDAAITTGPLIMRAPRGQLVMLGTEAGLVALDAVDLNPLWRVATESDAPQGMLAAVDLDADGTDEVVMITRRGRVVVINVGTGKIKWFAEGATDAMKAAFADVNGDGTTDVLVAGGVAFALGLSGKDGTLIWRADEIAPGRAGVNIATTPRVLVAGSFGNGDATFLVGADTGRTDLRAVGLPGAAAK